MGIWRNIGKIVTLVFQIVHEQVKWYIHSWKGVKRISPKSERSSLNENIKEVKKIYQPRDINDYLEEQESLKRSKLMVDLCEQPFYDIEPE